MDIEEMHITFRTIGQQMGMQTIRAILPEDIDIYLNNSIITKVRSVVLENTTTQYNDKVTYQRNPISPINSIKTLYNYKNVSIVNGNGTRLTPYSIELEFDEEVMFYTALSIYYNSNNSFNCRLIEGDELQNTLNDYCNGSSWDYPVAEMKYKNAKMTVDIYTDNTNNIPNILGVRYINKPNKVKYSEIKEEQVNCNLPEHLHNEIITMAVREYFNSVGSTSQNPN